MYSYYYLGWDSFVQTSIQAWNDFYVQWIRNAKNVLLISYEELRNDQLMNNLKRISKFLNFKVDQKRISCTIKYRQGKFRRNKTCYNIHGVEDKLCPKCFIENNTFNAFTKKQTIWINSAIRNVKKEIKSNGINPSLISGYENTKVFIDICK